MIKIEMRNCNY